MKTRLEKINPEWRVKGWGGERIITSNDKYCGKILEFKPNSKLSNHYHEKSEHFLCQEGIFILTSFDTETAEEYKIELNPGDIVEIPSLITHQLETITGGKIIEFSSPETRSYRIAKGDSQK
jgi:mannose-6-phosphate isomerase-like protein (cupin superfamily)